MYSAKGIASIIAAAWRLLYERFGSWTACFLRQRGSGALSAVIALACGLSQRPRRPSRQCRRRQIAGSRSGGINRGFQRASKRRRKRTATSRAAGKPTWAARRRLGIGAVEPTT